MSSRDVFITPLTKQHVPDVSISVSKKTSFLSSVLVFSVLATANAC